METPPKLRVRCADVGKPNCNWQATGRDEEQSQERHQKMLLNSAASALRRPDSE
jgi:hypothetical protein